MKLCTLRNGTRDGALFVASSDGSRCKSAASIAPSMQAALDDWASAEPALRIIADTLEAGEGVPLDVRACLAPLPRAYEWVDGSAYIHHIVLVRRARGAPLPPRLHEEPLVYQGGSSTMLAPTDDVSMLDASFGLDLEAEIGVVLGDTPRGTTKEHALDHVRLVVLLDDFTFRNLVPPELEKGFGFFQSKPATGFAPFAITPDALGPLWREGRLHARMRVLRNETVIGDLDTGVMHFSFADLIAHITRTRDFTAGTILGSGTISNEGDANGTACIVEKRMRELLEDGAMKTPFLAEGEHITIECLDAEGRNLFGPFTQRVVR
jgi:fumarylacetoacetate (FAA) hydrolase